MGNKQHVPSNTTVIEKVAVFTDRELEQARNRIIEQYKQGSRDILNVLSFDRASLNNNDAITYDGEVVPQSNVTHINISYNRFMSVPIQLQNSTIMILNKIPLLNASNSLTLLDLSCNALETIPGDVLSQFNVLQELNLYHNKIKSLPNELYHLVSLKRLNIACNMIEEISSEGIRQLTQLEYLNLSFNPISNVSSLDGLYNLQELVFCKYPEIEEARAPLPSMTGNTALR
jgi:Leucine-rich repeat (LRR) protein